MGKPLPSVTNLLIFKPGSTHSFDRFLRDALQQATGQVSIADTYVAGGLFDTLLEEVPTTIPIRFVYRQDTGGFATRASRFAKQYDFSVRVSQNFHDRFLAIDGRGYLVGPSLKDAADKKPATVVALNTADSQRLLVLFEDIWKKAKQFSLT